VLFSEKFDMPQRGVDSGLSMLDDMGKATLVRDLATRERNVIVMTGATDFVSDGKRTFAVKNGHEYLCRITGSGCALGTIMSAMLAVHQQDKLVAAIVGILHFEIAAEIAAEREDVQGPGTFVPAFIDELHNIRIKTMRRELSWLRRAKIEAIPLNK
jgi:thiamine-phosphate diphosphorylase / hydroxyethylthiazole kinase